MSYCKISVVLAYAMSIYTLASIYYLEEYRLLTNRRAQLIKKHCKTHELKAIELKHVDARK